MRIQARSAVLFACVVMCFVSGCMTLQSDSGDEKRTAIQQMRYGTLETLFRQQPSARNEILAAPGYAVFSDADWSTQWIAQPAF